MIEIRDGIVVRVEQYEIVQQVSADDVKEQINALNQSVESINEQIKLLESDLELIIQLQGKLKIR